jgi:hypothetical protein
MDVIAGEVAFLPELIASHAQGEISFEKISELRDRLCPEASQQSSVIGIVRGWPLPAVLVHAAPGLRRDQQRKLAQHAFDFHDGPQELLRAIHVRSNTHAERTALIIPENMRIPAESVISQVVEGGTTYLEAEEDLALWKSSSGRDLAPRPVYVKARRSWRGTDALILPR